MASLAHERAMLALSFTESLCISLKEWYRIMNRKSERLFRLIELLTLECNKCIMYYPMPKTVLELKHMEVKINYLKDWINAKHGTKAPVGTSLVIGLITDLKSYVDPDGAKGRSLNRMLELLNQLHTYFDRKGNRDTDYDKAWKAIEIHEELLNSKVRKYRSSKNLLRESWWIEFKDGKKAEVMKAA